jgi:hypothetical protein
MQLFDACLDAVDVRRPCTGERARGEERRRRNRECSEIRKLRGYTFHDVSPSCDQSHMPNTARYDSTLQRVR